MKLCSVCRKGMSEFIQRVWHSVSQSTCTCVSPGAAKSHREGSIYSELMTCVDKSMLCVPSDVPFLSIDLTVLGIDQDSLLASAIVKILSFLLGPWFKIQ